MCDKAPLQNLFDEGLAPLYEAIADLAQRCRPGQPWALDLDNPIRWYVSKRLGWQAVATSAAYVFTEHHGALIMPNEWSLFLLSLQSHFKNLDRHPLISEIYEWTLNEKAQRLVAYGRTRIEKKRADAKKSALSASEGKEGQH